MGLAARTLAALLIYGSLPVFARVFQALSDAVIIASQAFLSLGRALQVLSLPPGSSPYTGASTPWDAAWQLLTLRALYPLVAPGSFLRDYALLAGPALAVAAVACLALFIRSPWMADVIVWLRSFWIQVLGGTALLLSLALSYDALRCYLAQGRLFLGALRGSTAALGFFSGVVALAGSVDADGFTRDQVRAWYRALGLASICLTAKMGGITLIFVSFLGAGGAGAGAEGGSGAGSGDRLLAAASAAVAGGGAGGQRASAAAVGSAVGEVTDRLAFLVYGTILLLVAATAGSSLTESRTFWRLGVAVVRLTWSLLKPLGTEVVQAARRFVALPTVRMALAAGSRADDVVSEAVWEWGSRTAVAAVAAAKVVREGLLPFLQATSRLVLEPLGRLAAAAGRAAREAATAGYQHALLPALRALRALHRTVLLPLAAQIWDLTRRLLLPAVWPAAALTGTAWFGQQAVAQRAVLPFGAAAYVCGVIAALMAGKMMRKSPRPGLSRAGSLLEAAAASAYLHLDLGTGGVAARALAAAVTAALVVATVALSVGRHLAALLAGPLAGLLVAVATMVAWVLEVLWLLLYPWLVAAWEVLEAVWAAPELALVLSGAALAGAYVSHRMGLVGLVVGAAWGAATTGLAWLLVPFLRLLTALGPPLVALCGISSGASTATASGASATVAAWGRRAATDITSLFASPSFAVAFLVLNLLHALLLKGWAVPALRQQGAVGKGAEVPVISFVARSTGKVALAPVYVAAAAALLSGSMGRDVAGGLAALTAPTLWGVYLGMFWVEAVRRIALSYDPRSSSEFAAALRAVRTASTIAATATPVPATDSTNLTTTTPPSVPPRVAATSPAVVPSRPSPHPGQTPTAAAPTSPAFPPTTGLTSQPPTVRPAATSAPTAANRLLPSTAPTAPRPPPPAPLPPQPHPRSGFAATVAAAGTATAAAAAAAAATVMRAAAGSRAAGGTPPRQPANTAVSGPERVRTQLRSQRAPQHVFPTDSCAVCLEDLDLSRVLGGRGRGVGLGRGVEGEVGAELGIPVSVLRCGHAFHTPCILEWLPRNGRCPVCREPAVGSSRHANMFF